MSDEKKCPFCAEMIKAEAIKCKHCGSNLASPHGEVTTQNAANYQTEKRSVGIAYILWLILGGFGAHKFYLGNVFAGFFYICCLALSGLHLPLGLLILLWIWDGFTLGNTVYEFNDRLLNKRSPTPTTAPTKQPGEGDFLNWFFGVKPQSQSPTNKLPGESADRVKTEPD